MFDDLMQCFGRQTAAQKSQIHGSLRREIRKHVISCCMKGWPVSGHNPLKIGRPKRKFSFQPMIVSGVTLAYLFES